MLYPRSMDTKCAEVLNRLCFKKIVRLSNFDIKMTCKSGDIYTKYKWKICLTYTCIRFDFHRISTYSISKKKYNNQLFGQLNFMLAYLMPTQHFATARKGYIPKTIQRWKMAIKSIAELNHFWTCSTTKSWIEPRNLQVAKFKFY